MTTTQFELLNSAGTATHLLDDAGGATHLGTVTAAALSLTSPLAFTGSTVITGSMDVTDAVTGTDEAINGDLTINHATQVGVGVDASAAQLTTARTAGYIAAVRTKTTSIAAGSGATIHAGVYGLAPTDAGGSATHVGLYDAGNDYGFYFVDNVLGGYGTGSSNVPDVTIGWDATQLNILVAADDTVIKVGNGTLSADVWVYGNTASDYVLWDASAGTLSFQGAATITTGAVATIGGKLLSPMTAAQVLGAADTILLPTTGINKALSSVAARTGLILTVGTAAGQMIILMNVNASDNLTFDATPATSHVAATTCAIPAGTAKLFTWNATTSLWYPVG